MERGEVINNVANRLYSGAQEWREVEAFKRGAWWADTHQMLPIFDWKDVKTHPKQGTKILVDTIGIGFRFLKWDKRIFPWKKFVQSYEVYRWMDLDEIEIKEMDELPFERIND